MSKASQWSDPVAGTPRKRLTVADKVNILERQHYLCAACGESLCLLDEPGTFIGRIRIYAPMIDEHIIPLELGGSNDLSNRELRCVPCAKAKTKGDQGDIARAKRRQAKNDGTRKRKGPRLKGRGFRKDSKRKRTLSGKVVDR